MEIDRQRAVNAEPRERGGDRLASGFTLVEVLVSMSVIAVLVGLMLPSLTNVRETSNRVVCSSNVRQVGLGLAMYCDDNKGFLPSSVFLSDFESSQFSLNGSQMMIVKLADPASYNATQPWDGLGRLYSADYLLAPKVFYCPSHRGEHPYQKYAAAWSGESVADDVYSNYHFRGEGPDGVRQIERIDPQTSALVTDGLRSVTDYNHKVGSNVLYADLSVRWYLDAGGNVSQLLRDSGTGGSEGGNYRDIWKSFDSPGGTDDGTR